MYMSDVSVIFNRLLVLLIPTVQWLTDDITQCGVYHRASVGYTWEPMWGKRESQCGVYVRASVKYTWEPVWGIRESQCGVYVRASVKYTWEPVWSIRESQFSPHSVSYMFCIGVSKHWTVGFYHYLFYVIRMLIYEHVGRFRFCSYCLRLFHVCMVLVPIFTI